jgi:hypothetical protein
MTGNRRSKFDFAPSPVGQDLTLRRGIGAEPAMPGADAFQRPQAKVATFLARLTAFESNARTPSGTATSRIFLKRPGVRQSEALIKVFYAVCVSSKTTSFAFLSSLQPKNVVWRS